MITRFIGLLLLLAFLLAPVLAFSVGNPVTQSRIDYSTTTVTTTAWTTVVADMPSVVSTIEIFDSSGKTLQLGIGAAGSETRMLYVLPGGNGQVRLNMPQSSRLSIKGVSGAATSGELTVNLYN